MVARNRGFGVLGLLFLVLVGMGLSGCATHRYTSPRPGFVQRGVASWYGEKFHGRKTASGAVYDMYSLSAAHRELPLGTVVEVRNLDNGRVVQVVINDRGPWKRGRILDLSLGAARALDMADAGLARVEIRVVEVGGGRPGASPSRTANYTVQLGAFRDAANAASLKQRVVFRHPETTVNSQGGWHRVQIGAFKKKSEARQLQKELARQGLAGVVIGLH